MDTLTATVEISFERRCTNGSPRRLPTTVSIQDEVRLASHAPAPSQPADHAGAGAGCCGGAETTSVAEVTVRPANQSASDMLSARP